MAKYIYIDDEFYERINENSYTRYDWSDHIDIDDLRKIIEGLPAVDAEPVRHAHWVKSPEYKGDDTSGYIDNHWTCSECGEEAIVNEWYMYDLTDYCPHCGAKMGGEE